MQHFCAPYAIRPLSVCPVCLSVTFVHCGQTVGRIKMKLGMHLGLGSGHIVLHGDPAHPPPKGHSHPPIFDPYLLRPNCCVDQDVTWYGARPRPRRRCVKCGPRSPLPKGREPQKISAHVYYGQTAGWMKLVLGMEVGLGPCDIVLDGDPAPSPKRGRSPSPIFGPFLLWPYDWMHQDATWYGCRPQPRGLCVRWRPSPPYPKRGGTPKFSAHVYCGQTAGWIKMRLRTKVGLSPGDSVLHGDPASSPQRGWSPLPNFRHTSIVAKRLDASRCHLVWR